MNRIPAEPGRQPGGPRGAELLAHTAGLGEYFALPALGDGAGEELGTLLHDQAAVREFVDRTRSAIAESRKCDRSDIPVRLAASAFQLGVVARLLSPAIGAAASLGEVPMLTAGSVKWRTNEDHIPMFGFDQLDWVPAATPTLAAAAISASLLGTVVAPLNDTLRSAVSLSKHVSWGNTISAANGAVTVMALSRPEHERSGRAVVAALLATEYLARTGDFTRDAFVRRSCCLFYLAPQSGFCQDCVLTAADGSQPTGLD